MRLFVRSLEYMSQVEQEFVVGAVAAAGTAGSPRYANRQLHSAIIGTSAPRLAHLTSTA